MQSVKMDFCGPNYCKMIHVKRFKITQNFVFFTFPSLVVIQCIKCHFVCSEFETSVQIWCKHIRGYTLLA